MSFLQYKKTRPDLKWGRADIDGAPFKPSGKAVPLLRNDEFEALAERIPNCRARTFCMGDEKDAEEYVDILNAIRSGWFELLGPREYKWETINGKPVMFVYIEWSEPHMEIDPSKLASIGAVE